MTVAYGTFIDGSGTVVSTLNIGSLTVSGSLPYVLVAIGTGGSPDATSGVTLNGVSMNLVSPFPVNNNNGCSVFGLTGTGGATTGNIIVTNSNARVITVVAALFNGVNQTTPIGTVAEAGYSSATSFSSGVITGVDGNGLFVGGLSTRYQPSVSAENGSPTLIDYKYDGSAGSTRLVYQTGAASYTYSGTIGSSSGVAWGVYLNSGIIPPTYYPLARRRRTFIPIVFPR